MATKQYAWTNVKIVALGREFKGVTGIKYRTSQEKEYVYGAGSDPMGIQSGNKSAMGEITLLQSELEALTRAAGTGKDIHDIPAFDIIVSYVPAEGMPIITDIIKDAEFYGDVEKGMNQNDKFMSVTCQFMALSIQKGV